MRDQPSGFFNPWFQLALNVLGVLAYELLLKAGAKLPEKKAGGTEAVKEVLRRYGEKDVD